MMTTEIFANRTKGFLRSAAIVAVENALRAYHALQPNAYAARRDGLNQIIAAADAYTGGGSTKHLAAVGELRAESMVVRAAYQLVLDAAALGAGHEVDAVRLLLRAQTIAAELQLQDAGGDQHGTRLNNAVRERLNPAAAALTANQQDEIVRDDVNRLAQIGADGGAPDITRTVLQHLVAFQHIVTFAHLGPGTTLSPPGSPMKYTLKNPAFHLLGEPERLATLAHELTHVEAGETYHNTALLLLFPAADIGNDDVIRKLIETRTTAVNDLRNLFDAEDIPNAQRQLINSKLNYAGEQARIARYTATYRDAGKINDATYTRLSAIDAFGPGNGVLVEFDTVLNQLLVLLHLWNVDPAQPSYARVRQLAQQQFELRQRG